MVSLQEMINSRTNEENERNFLALQQIVLQVSLYGDDTTSGALYKYYTAIISSAQAEGTPLDKKQHQDYQKHVLNGMHAHLGLGPLPSFEIFKHTGIRYN